MQLSPAPAPRTRSLAGALVAILLAAQFTMILVAEPVAGHDGDPISMSGATFLDNDGNGRFDAVRIAFDGDHQPNAATIRPTDFSVSGMTVLGCVSTGDNCAGGGSTVTLTLLESLAYQTGGALPTVTYTPGTMTVFGPTSPHASAAAQTISGTDGANPVFLAAYAQKDDTSIVARFSEVVENHKRGDTEDAADMDLTERDFCYKLPSGTFASNKGAPTSSGSQLTLPFTGMNAAIPDTHLRQAEVKFDEATPPIVPDPSDGGDDAGCNSTPGADGPPHNTPHDDPTIQDAAGNTVDPTAKRQPVQIEPLPAAGVPPANAFHRGAYGNIGSPTVYVVFNGPVATATGTALPASAFQYENNGGTGSSGIVTVSHTAHSNVVAINLNTALKSDDIAAAPAGDRIRVLGGNVLASGDANNGYADDLFLPLTAGPIIAPGDASFWAPIKHNRLTPHPIGFETVDNNKDGILDAVAVIFSESVKGTPVGGEWVVRTLSGITLGSDAADPAKEYVLATGATSCAMGGVLPVRTNGIYVCLKGAPKLGTNAPVMVSYKGTSLTDIGTTPSGTDAPTQVAKFANMVPVDRAAPVILQAATKDTDGNGFLDKLEITFSEPVVDSGFLPGEWTVLDDVDGTVGNGDDFVYTVSSTLDTGTKANDEIIRLTLSERSTPDTGVVPHVVFTPLAGGLKDVAGIPVAAADTRPATQSAFPPDVFDTARPVLVKAAVTVGTASVVMTFSEPVDDAQGMGGPLLTGDLTYNNVDAAGASGFSGPINHVAGEAKATVTLNAAVTDSDLSSDTITINANSVYDNAAATKRDFANENVIVAPVGTDNIAVSRATAMSVASGPSITTAKTLDRNGDGLLDGIELTFSQAIRDDSGVSAADCDNLEPAEWTIKLAGTTLVTSTDGVKMTTYANDQNGDCDVLDSGESTPGGEVNDNKIYLHWTGTIPSVGALPGWNTAQLPTLDYANDGAGGFIRALSDGAPLAPFTARVTTDGAPPVLLTASGSGKSLTLAFSEPVRGSGASNTLRIQDFTYLDNAAGGASAMASIGSHTPPAATVTATMNQDFTTSDLNVDQVQAKTTIRDLADLVATSRLVTVRDGTPPVILQVATIDADANGLIDAIRVRMNEAIADGPGCTGIDALGPWSLTLGGNAIPITSIVSSATGAPCDSAGANDADIFLRFAESDARHTGVRPTVAYDATHAAAEIADTAGNKLGTIGATQAVDRALPVLLSTEATTGKKEAATQDLDGDGRIDGFRLVFSEPILDSTFVASDWSAGGAANGDPHGITGISTGASPNDAVFVITFAEGTAFDTAEKPTLIYSGTTGLTDVAGNKAAPMLAGSILVVDRARPTITVISATAGQAGISMEFSEPLWNAPGQPFGGQLATSDFAYTNGNGAGAGGLASMTHTAGQKGLSANLDVAATAADLDEDLIGPQAAAIFDGAGNAATFAPVNLQGDVFDAIAPGQIDDLSVNEGIEQLTLEWTTPSDSDLDALDIRISEDPIDSDAAFEAADSISDGTIGNAITVPAPVAGGVQRVTVTGLTPGTEYHFALTVSDNSGNTAPRSNSASGTPLAPDTTAPGHVTLEFVVATGNSLKFAWVPVGDDGQSGTVDHYEVKISTAPIPDAAAFDAAASAAAAFEPSSLLPGGSSSQQAVTVTQIGGVPLEADTTYYVAVRGVDEAGNKGSFTALEGLTLGRDVSAPIGVLVISSSTHQIGIATRNNDPTFSWAGLSDAESEITYHYALNQDPDYVPSASDAGQTTGTSVSFTDIAPGDWYFHLIGISQGGASEAASFHIVVQAAVSTDEIASANAAVQATVNVTRELSNNIITWDLSGIVPPPAGVDIWRAISPFVKIATLVGDAAYAGTYTDVGAPSDAKYIVTVWYEQTPEAGNVDALNEAAGYEGKSDDELAAMAAQNEATAGGPGDDSLYTDWPFWAGLVVLVAAAGIVLVGVVRYNRTRRD